MQKITTHPIIEITPKEQVSFTFNGQKINAEKGFSVAAALHQAGFPVHSHSLKNRNRSVECGIGKCGACEMLVDGKIKRICITKVDEVSEVQDVPRDYKPTIDLKPTNQHEKVYKTKVAIIGAGPAGLATREILNQHEIPNIVIDNNTEIGGQFLMQTHQFFFFEKEKKYGGMRGFDIAKTLAGENHEGILLNSTVWEILSDKKIAVKNIETDEIYFIEAEHLVVATGAVPFMPTFENDDVPGVYTAAVIQKMMNTDLTLLGKNILTIGAGNIGYLTSYQLVQAGAKVKAIIEAQDKEGGFPVQANRIRRLGIPVVLSHMIIKAIPNADYTGIIGAIVAECIDFKPIAGTEKIIDGIDAINVCTGLVPDNQLLTKGYEIFGRNCYGAGDAIRIGEGTSAVLKGKQIAYEILENINVKYDYNTFLNISKEYIDSQQHPIKIIEKPFLPNEKRANEKPFVQIDCLYGFACNPCEFACTYGAITKTSTSTVPRIDYDKCVGCMDCVYQCPGLAIFGYNLKNDTLFLPIEFNVEEKIEVFLIDNQGEKLGEGIVEKILKKKNKTNIARVKSLTLKGNELTNVKGFIAKNQFTEKPKFEICKDKIDAKTYICHCDDVQMEEIEEVIGTRKFISIDEIKHTTRLGMGACRGKRCIKRLKLTMQAKGISIIGEPTPRGPLSNQIAMGELYPKTLREKIITDVSDKKHRIVKVQSLVAGGGIGGSSLFRYLAEAGLKPTLINYGHGASWRNIAGGRPNFSVPELSDIAMSNLQIFKDIQSKTNIDFASTQYVTFAHDQEMYLALEKSMQWSDAYMISANQFKTEVSPQFNTKQQTYSAALVNNNCWQANPGKVVDAIRQIGIDKGGIILEDSKLIDLQKDGNTYKALVFTHNNEYVEYQTEIFINALGEEGNKFALKVGLETDLYSVKHQAFITRRLPMLGKNGNPLAMLIDRQKYKGFSAVYGQQLAETGQIIGCASPLNEFIETEKNVKSNSLDFLKIVSEIFIDWIPELSSVGFQAIWSGYYIEPRMFIDTEKGLFTGLRGQGFMLGQYLAKMYVDKLTGIKTPEYFSQLSVGGNGLLERAFK